MDAEYYFSRGIEKSKVKDLNGAIEDYSSALIISLGKERKTITKQNSDGSLESVNVIEESVGYENIYFNRACAYLDLAQYDNAISDLSKFIEYNQNDAEVFFKRAIAHYSTGNEADAARDLKVANSLDSNYNEQAFLAVFGLPS